MAFIPVPNTVAATLVHTFLSQRMTNTIYTRFENPINPSDLENLATDLVNLWAQNVMPYLSNQTSLVGVSCKDLTVQNGQVYEYTGTPLPVSGDVAGPALPSSVAVVVSLRTGRAGRSYRGRLYLGGFSETQSDGNFFFGNLPTLLRDAISNVIQGLNSGTRQVVVVSRFTENNPRTVGETTPVIAVLARTVRVASQRKRLP